MSSKFGIEEVRTLIDGAMTLAPESVAHAFDSMGGHDITGPDTLGTGAHRLLSTFAPILDQTDYVNVEGHNPKIAKKFETNKKLLACHGMLTALRRGPDSLKAEATTAGLDLPTFTRLHLMTISAAYAKLFTPELFAVVPLTQPTGRIHFKDDYYDSSLVTSSPNITGGTDRLDDPAKFNVNYFAAPEGQVARSNTFKYSSLDVSAKDYRLFFQWTDTLADDAQAVYGDDARAHLINRGSTEMSRLVDISMLSAVIAGYNTANQEDFTQAPTSNPNYTGLTPSEREHYDAMFYRGNGVSPNPAGMIKLFNDMAKTRRFNADGEPTWSLIGSDYALALASLNMFVPFQNAIDDFGGATGALRDFGTLKGMNIRFLVVPQLGSVVSGGAAHGYFGRTPMMRDDVGIKWCPYINLQGTRDRYDPENGMTTVGLRSRFAIAQPNTGSNARSSQLGDIYGRHRLV